MISLAVERRAANQRRIVYVALGCGPLFDQLHLSPTGREPYAARSTLAALHDQLALAVLQLANALLQRLDARKQLLAQLEQVVHRGRLRVRLDRRLGYGWQVLLASSLGGLELVVQGLQRL